MWAAVVGALGAMLCTIGAHDLPDERVRWTDVGWYGNCTRCGCRLSGIEGRQ